MIWISRLMNKTEKLLTIIYVAFNQRIKVYLIDLSVKWQSLSRFSFTEMCVNMTFHMKIVCCAYWSLYYHINGLSDQQRQKITSIECTGLLDLPLTYQLLNIYFNWMRAISSFQHWYTQFHISTLASEFSPSFRTTMLKAVNEMNKMGTNEKCWNFVCHTFTISIARGASHYNAENVQKNELNPFSIRLIRPFGMVKK